DTPQPTQTPAPTQTSAATQTPAPTLLPAPTISSAPTTANCGSVLTVNGTNFGSPPTSNGADVQLLGGPASSGTPRILSLVGPGSPTQLTAVLPTSSLPTGNYSLVVTTNSGASNSEPLSVTGC
ncbi:MAG: hypothetical protein JO057_17335, partial [Chloroflexi bacterium]|nr:hypothetical protein [Chloroflexota bacterium]